MRALISPAAAAKIAETVMAFAERFGMDVREAIATAKAFAQEAFGPDGLGEVRLEEVDHDDVAQDWLITLGLYRPAIASRAHQIAAALGNSEMQRSYKVFRVSEDTGAVKSVKVRPSVDQD